ncbi:DUF4164 domain-containing protein [Jiella sp. M17.18]|uniref:DUF4164 domain-containing protein n=1 Tax=Jiella sp. M17.18 TaxID=3234247 RepID=UPI0034DFEB8B
MASQDPFEAARERLRAAVEQLSEAVDGRLSRESAGQSVEVEIQRQTADRARLARELDAALAHSQRLERVNRDVSHRLVDAMEHVRRVLDRHK